MRDNDTHSTHFTCSIRNIDKLMQQVDTLQNFLDLVYAGRQAANIKPLSTSDVSYCKLFGSNLLVGLQICAKRYEATLIRLVLINSLTVCKSLSKLIVYYYHSSG